MLLSIGRLKYILNLLRTLINYELAFVPMNGKVHFVIPGIIILLAIATASGIEVPASALKTNNQVGASTGAIGKSTGAVPLIPIQTGDSHLDKQVQQFYSCIKKTGHTGGSKPEPSRDEVNACYFQVFTSNDGSNNVRFSHSYSHGQRTSTTEGVSVPEFADTGVDYGNNAR